MTTSTTPLFYIIAEESNSYLTRSKISCSMESSSQSAAAVTTQAKAEAAKAHLKFTNEELRMQLEKVRVESAMDILSLKKEVVTAEVEAEVL